VEIVLDASPERVWDDVRDIASHVEWMQDAVAIDFTSEQRSGVGTTFDCDTRIGPFRLTDHMEITSWEPGREMGVRHVGIVTGSGVFTLEPVHGGRARRGGGTRTRFVWTEQLQFPWYLGGALGAFAARPVLAHVWRTNLRNLAARFER
jgi:hypothetical protein